MSSSTRISFCPADLEDLGSPRRRQGDAGRVVEVRDRVEELDAPSLAAQVRDGLPQCLRNEPVIVHGDVHHARLVRAEDAEGADVAGRLGEDHVARIDEQLRHQVEGLLRAGRGDDVVDRSADALERHDVEDLLPQRGDALAGAVLQGRRALRAHHAFHRRDDQLLREGGDERHAAGEGDDLGAGGDGEEGSDLGGGEPGGSLGVVRVPGVEIVAGPLGDAVRGHFASVLLRVFMLVAGFGRPVRDDGACSPRHPEPSSKPETRKTRPACAGRVSACARRPTTRCRRRGRPRGRASAWRR